MVDELMQLLSTWCDDCQACVMAIKLVQCLNHNCQLCTMAVNLVGQLLTSPHMTTMAFGLTLYNRLRRFMIAVRSFNCSQASQMAVKVIQYITSSHDGFQARAMAVGLT